jgi:hypothetical protein
MITCLGQRRNDAAHCFERRSYIGVLAGTAAIVETNDSTVAYTRQDAFCNV